MSPGRRPWLTVVLNDKFCAVAGDTVFLGDPTALQTAFALRQAIWRKTDPAEPNNATSREDDQRFGATVRSPISAGDQSCAIQQSTDVMCKAKRVIKPKCCPLQQEAVQ